MQNQSCFELYFPRVDNKYTHFIASSSSKFHLEQVADTETVGAVHRPADNSY